MRRVDTRTNTYPKTDLNLSTRKYFGSFQTMKLPIPLKYELAPKDGIVKTLEGTVSYLAGDAIMTGTAGEKWPIPASKFRASYDFYEGDESATKRPLLIWAEQMPAPFQVTVNWGEHNQLQGNPLDYLVQYGEGDFGTVRKDIFHTTYDLEERPVTPPLDTESAQMTSLRSRWVSPISKDD